MQCPLSVRQRSGLTAVQHGGVRSSSLLSARGQARRDGLHDGAQATVSLGPSTFEATLYIAEKGLLRNL